MAVNKIEIGGEVKIDISDTTAVAASVESGKVFYDNGGVRRTGGMVIQKYYTGSSAPSTSTGADGDLYLVVGG